MHLHYIRIMGTLQRITSGYFKEKRPKKSHDNYESINTLVNIGITQSQSIRVGTSIEDLLRIYISSTSSWIDIKPPNAKGKKERDHLFYRTLENGKTEKIYAELKSNLQLDSEKRSKTAEKVKCIMREENCKGYITALRHFSSDTLNKSKHVSFYTERDVDVLSVQEYFNILNIACPFEDEDEYKKWIRFIVDCLIEEDIPNEERDAVATLVDLKTLKDANHKLNNETDC